MVFLFVHCSESLRFQILCDKELVHLQVVYNLQRRHFCDREMNVTDIKRRNIDALLTELKESADLETIKLGIFCSSKLWNSSSYSKETEGDFAKKIIVMAAEEKCPCAV